MVITSSTRNRVGGNTPRGFESHLLRQNKDHPSGWSLFFTPKVGFERRLLETCQWHVSTAVGARRPTTSKIFNGCLPQKRNPTAQISAPAPYGGMGGSGQSAGGTLQPPWEPAGRQPLKYLMVAHRRKGIPSPRSQRPLCTEGWAALSRVHEVLA